MTPEQIESASYRRIEELWEFYVRDQHKQGLLEIRVTFEPSKGGKLIDIYRQILMVAAMKEAGMLTRYNDSLVARREKVPGYGDLLTKEEFIADCKSGMLMSCDGSGDVSDGVMVDPYHGVSCSKVANDEYDWPDWVTHVVWYNK